MLWSVLALDGETVFGSDERRKCASHGGYAALGKNGYDTSSALGR